MSLSHACSNTSTSSIKEIFEQLSLSTKSICQRSLKDEFAQLEIELHQKFAEADRQCMKKLLEQYVLSSGSHQHNLLNNITIS